MEVDPTREKFLWRCNLRLKNHAAMDDYSIAEAKVVLRIAKVDRLQKWINKAKMLPRKYQQLVADAELLNFNVFLDELCQALIKPQMTSEDRIPLVQMISRFHQEYDAFNEKMVRIICKYMLSNEILDEQVKAQRRSCLLNLLSEMFVVGMPFPLQKILQAIKDIFDSKEIKKAVLNYQIAASFIDLFSYQLMGCKNDTYVSIQQEGKMNLAKLIPPDKKTKLHSFFSNFLDWFCKTFVEITKTLGKETDQRTTELLDSLQKTHIVLGLTVPELILPPKREEQFLSQDLLYVNTEQTDFYSQFPSCEHVTTKRKDDQDRSKLKDQFVKLVRETKIDSKEKADLIAIDILKGCNDSLLRKLFCDELFNRRDIFRPQFWVRMLAILARYQKDLPEVLMKLFIDKYERSKKNGINNQLDKRKRYIRIFGELIKFRVLQPERGVYLLREITNQLTSQNNEILLTFLDTCGRFLYVCQSSSIRMKQALAYLNETVKTSCLTLQVVTAIRTATFQLVPGRQTAAVKKKERSAIESKIRQLIMFDLNCENFEEIADQIKDLKAEGLSLKITERILKSARKCSYPDLKNLAVLTRLLAQPFPDLTPGLLYKINEHFRHKIGQSPQEDIQLARLYGQLFVFDLLSRKDIERWLINLLENVGHRVLRIEMYCHVLMAIYSFYQGSYAETLGTLVLKLLMYYEEIENMPMMRKHQVEDLILQVLPEVHPLLKIGKVHAFYQFHKASSQPLSTSVKYFLELENRRITEQLQKNEREELNKKEQKEQKEQKLQEQTKMKEPVYDDFRKEDEQFASEYSQFVQNQIEKTEGRMVKPVMVQQFRPKKTDPKGKKLLVRQGKQVIPKAISIPTMHQADAQPLISLAIIFNSTNDAP